MKILIIGSGGREHAIGAKLAESPKVKQLYFATGNGGTAQLGKNIEANSIEELRDFAVGKKVDLTIVGSEALLVEGIVDVFQKAGLTIFGPHKKASLLEGSKAFAKEFMQKYNIKTATYRNFNNYDDALAYLETIEYPTVVKASGLAAGKGVVIAENKEEAKQALQEIMQDKVFGDSGSEVVIEEFLEGVEASILSYYNGKEILPFISAKDHKKIGERETGLNTGGMGVIAPNPYVTEAVFRAFEEDILQPTLKGLEAEQLQFAGVIFFGLMITQKRVYLLEYNLRMGDPETQAVLPLLETDLLSLTEDAIAGNPMTATWKSLHSCCVVMVSGGYPQEYAKGLEVKGLEDTNTSCFIAGANEKNGKLYTSGGRVLNIVATGTTAQEAHKKAYEEIAKVSFQDCYYRKDIGGLE